MTWTHQKKLSFEKNGSFTHHPVTVGINVLNQHLNLLVRRLQTTRPVNMKLLYDLYGLSFGLQRVMSNTIELTYA